MAVQIVDTAIIDNIRNAPILTFSGDSASVFVLRSGAVRNVANNGIGIEMGGPFQTISISGNVIGGGIGLYLNVGAFSSHVTVERGAFVSSLQCNADALHLRNDGSIGWVSFNGDPFQPYRFENTGRVDRFLGSDAADIVSNAGIIPFAVMGGGDDVYDGSASRMARAEILMQEGNDTATGSRYADTIDGGSGDDVIGAAGGDDRIFGGVGSDQLDGGAGTDTFDAFDADNASIINLATGLALSISPAFGAIAEDTLRGFENVAAGFLDDTLIGSATSNILDGLPGNDLVSGAAGDDQLIGGDGSDSLNGGLGRDKLIGGAGRDFLIGGPGADRFVYGATADSTLAIAGRDIISDFVRGEDRIDLSRIDAAGTPGSFSLPFVFIGTQAFEPSSPGEVRIRPGPATYVFLNTDEDAAAESIIQLAGRIALTASDFIL